MTLTTFITMRIDVHELGNVDDFDVDDMRKTMIKWYIKFHHLLLQVDESADTDDSDFSTKSSLEFLRLSEAFSIFLEQRVAEDNFAEFQAALQVEFRKRKPPRYLSAEDYTL